MTQPIDRETAITLLKQAGALQVSYNKDRHQTEHSLFDDQAQRFYDLAVAHSRKDAEPAAYQYRMKPEWHDAWVKWQPCDKANFDDYVKAPVVNGWQFDARALFTHPPETDKLLQQALDGKDDGIGTNNEPWHTQRKRLIELRAECERLRAALRKVYALVGRGGSSYEIYHRVDPVIREAIDARGQSHD